MRYRVKVGGAMLLLALAACSGNSASGNDATGSSMPNAADAPTNAAMMQPLPAATSNDYPPCSATVKDHCVEK